MNRCDDCDDRGRCNGKGRGLHVMNIHDCHTCGGLGFLYPDPPDWWEEMWNQTFLGKEVADDAWEQHCRTTWRVLKVTEDTE